MFATDLVGTARYLNAVLCEVLRRRFLDAAFVGNSILAVTGYERKGLLAFQQAQAQTAEVRYRAPRM